MRVKMSHRVKDEEIIKESKSTYTSAQLREHYDVMLTEALRYKRAKSTTTPHHKSLLKPTGLAKTSSSARVNQQPDELEENFDCKCD
jgi:hypothetical protein